mmetsp:Transcript_53029/g.137207  ORF Transcript_53029/g.137207 Transcript_53029/m.137207 type:complete len:228 (+) Transcript_53029:628-1311(+)
MNKQLHLVGDQDHARTTSHHDALDAMLEDVHACVHVHCGQRRIQKVHVRTAVRSSCQGNALLLTAGQVHASLTNLCGVSLLHQGQVCLKGTSKNDCLVEFIIVGFPKQNVVPHRAMATPRRLGHIREVPPDTLAATELHHLAHDRLQKIGLPTSDRAGDHRKRACRDADRDVLKQGCLTGTVGEASLVKNDFCPFCPWFQLPVGAEQKTLDTLRSSDCLSEGPQALG